MESRERKLRSQYILRECAWCEKVLGCKEDIIGAKSTDCTSCNTPEDCEARKSLKVSHGICDDCLEMQSR